MSQFSFLNKKDIRNKLTDLQENQYDLFENLADYFETLVKHYDLGIVSANQMHSGTMSAVVELATAQRHIVIKISAREDLESEAFFLETARLHGIDAPAVIKADFTKSIIPFDYMFLKYIEGVTPEKLTAEQAQQSGYMFGENLARVHEVHADGVGSIRKNRYNVALQDWQKLLQNSLEQKWKGVYAKHPSSFPERHHHIVQKLLETSALHDFSPRLLHGDVGGNNYLTHIDAKNNVERVYFIDPGTWVGGDPMQDLAFSQISWNYPGFSEGVIKGYMKRHPLSPSEQQRFDILKVYNQFWATLISCMRDRDRWHAMFEVYKKLEKDIL